MARLATARQCLITNCNLTQCVKFHACMLRALRQECFERSCPCGPLINTMPGHTAPCAPPTQCLLRTSRRSCCSKSSRCLLGGRVGRGPAWAQGRPVYGMCVTTVLLLSSQDFCCFSHGQCQLDSSHGGYTLLVLLPPVPSPSRPVPSCLLPSPPLPSPAHPCPSLSTPPQPAQCSLHLPS